MSYILHINTALNDASVSLADNEHVIAERLSNSQKEHASFLQSAIQQLLKTTGIALEEIDAVAVTAGPGSYTGLRVGMASAKGLCYALKKPLLTTGTLEVLTASALRLFPNAGNTTLFCPMIDARRMEVFTAVYKGDLTPYLPPCAMILDETSFKDPLLTNKIMFFGSGSNKWKLKCKQANAIFETVSLLPESMSKRTNILYAEKKFTDLAYCEPFYLKEFQTVIIK